MPRQLIDIEENSLIQKCINGDPLAEKDLYSKYMLAMYNRAVRMLADTEDAKDVIQIVFVQVFKDLKNFRSESSLGTWIKRITINKCLDFLRSHKVQFVELEEIENESEEDIPLCLSVSEIHQAIRRLPDGCRSIFNLYLIEGYQHKEIAQIMKISESTSKTQYRRAKILMRELLKITPNE